MPKTPEKETPIEPPNEQTLYHFPTVGNGITVKAASYEEALALVQKL
jgi:hypothetical protein